MSSTPFKSERRVSGNEDVLKERAPAGVIALYMGLFFLNLTCISKELRMPFEYRRSSLRNCQMSF